MFLAAFQFCMATFCSHIFKLSAMARRRIFIVGCVVGNVLCTGPLMWCLPEFFLFCDSSTATPMRLADRGRLHGYVQRPCTSLMSCCFTCVSLAMQSAEISLLLQLNIVGYPWGLLIQCEDEVAFRWHIREQK